MRTEQEVQNSIRVGLSKLGHKVFRANVGKVKLADGRWFDTGLPKGFSDLFSVKDGKVYFWEVKNGKNKASEEQINFLEQMKKIGCASAVVYGMDDVMEVLRDY